MGLRTRRMLSIFVTIIAIGVAQGLANRFETRLDRADFFTGYTLLASTLLLFALSARKKLLVLPLGRVSGWLQAHQYLGIFALAVFWMHVGWPIHGMMEQILAAAFLFVSMSGVVTWYLNRTIPKKLRVAGAAQILEDIAMLRNRLSEKAYALAIQAAGKAESVSLAEHYGSKLIAFFQQPRSLAYIVVPNGRLRRHHLESLERLDRYLGPEGRHAREEMCCLVQQKDDLDFQEAMQRRMRLWRGLHTSLLWFLLVLIGIHTMMAHRFHGT